MSPNGNFESDTKHCNILIIIVYTQYTYNKYSVSPATNAQWSSEAIDKKYDRLRNNYRQFGWIRFMMQL